MGILSATPEVRLRAAVVLVGLAVLAYWPAVGLPFISDDYVQIDLARMYGPVSNWDDLARDPLYRCRATSLLLTYWTYELFGLSTWAYSCSSLAIHILNTWLVFALGIWTAVGWRVSTAAAAFFAIYQGHQEAVIWYAALPELLVFFFGLLSLLCWIRWLRSGGRAWYSLSIVCFVLALLSKESAVAVAGLMALAAIVKKRRVPLAIVPFGGLVAVYAALIFLARKEHMHFNDAGTFSLSAPFVQTLLRSTMRLFWFTGLLSLIALGVWREWRFSRLLAITGAWIVIGLLPYSFLTYMPFVPSRHTYLASVGLALIVGAAAIAIRDRFPGRWVPAAVATAVLLHQCGYIWFRKVPQFVERAAPTERLIEFARQVDGAVHVECFPYPMEVAELALEIRLNKKLSDSPRPAASFCWEEPHP